jgi:uncharacterized coiled-coil DUF342 family protein
MSEQAESISVINRQLINAKGQLVELRKSAKQINDEIIDIQLSIEGLERNLSNLKQCMPR